MAISFSCPCGKALTARDQLAGKKAKCPDCEAILIIPDPAEDAEYGVAPPVRPRNPPPRPESRRIVRPPEADRRPPARPSTFHPTSRGYELEPERPKPRPRPRYEPEALEDWEEEVPSSPYRESEPETRYESEEEAEPSRLREYSYCLLFFALIPLVFLLLGGEEERTVKQRIASTFKKATEEQIARKEAAKTLDEVLEAAPEGKLEGAHLARGTIMHWIYAWVAAMGFMFLLLMFFSVERANPLHLIAIGLFTGTIGIVLLLIVQLCSGLHLRFQGIRGGWIALIVILLMFIDWSYRSALDPNSNFFFSALGFTFGVGLCEELTKAIPLFFLFKWDSRLGWRCACLWGLASGVGFGVSEGIMYSATKYNGVTGADMYVVRFVSCVALHAMWAGAVGISIARKIDDYEDVSNAAEFGLFMLIVLAVPMTLHGFYDTLLKMDMKVGALFSAILSFAWFAYQIEQARREFPDAGAVRSKAKNQRRPAY